MFSNSIRKGASTMFARLLSVSTLVFSIVASSCICVEAVEHDPGEIVRVKLTGEVAREFARLCGRERGQDVKKVETSGTIVQKQDNGKYRIVVSQSVVNSDKTERMVTVMAVVDAAQLSVETLADNTPISTTPVDLKKPLPVTLVSHETKSTIVHLSELKGVKLRAWKIAEEVGQ